MTVMGSSARKASNRSHESIFVGELAFVVAQLIGVRRSFREA